MGSACGGIGAELRASTKRSRSEENEELGFEESVKRKSLILTGLELGR